MYIYIYTSIFQRVMLEYVGILRDVVPAPCPMEVPGRVPLKMSIDQQLLGLLPASTFKPHTPWCSFWESTFFQPCRFQRHHRTCAGSTLPIPDSVTKLCMVTNWLNKHIHVRKKTHSCRNVGKFKQTSTSVSWSQGTTITHKIWMATQPSAK